MWKSGDDLLHSAISNSLAPVMNLEKEWDIGKLSTRIRQYTKNAAKTLEFKKKSWGDLVNEYADCFFSSIFQALNDREWLLKIDLVEVIDAGVKATFPREVFDPVRRDDFERVVLDAHDRAFEEQRFAPMLWEAILNFSFDRKARNRVYEAFEAGRKEAALSSTGEVVDFMRWFILKSFEHLRRSSAAQGGVETALPASTCAELVHALLKAGALPLPLSDKFGHPPPGWPFVDDVVKDVYAGRNTFTSSPPGANYGSRLGPGAREKPPREMREGARENPPREMRDGSRRSRPERSSSGGNGSQGRWTRPKDNVRANDSDDSVEGVVTPQKKKSKVRRRHPRCTQSDDCIGDSSCGLVQHLLNGIKGDVYCTGCWKAIHQRYIEEGNPPPESQKIK
eukprot:TRINITY_DN3484_c0_g1_i1.p1 TRINITY_DN3484_c0_g1~~TRINITY_DN3484_c0_g1_i1.p1  ORF type:complete len:395 (-),score=71.35 TRINITY_DN3484_c0_g1_i1:95-1279(-)